MSKELSSSKETILNYMKTSLQLLKLENYENDGPITGTDTSNALSWSLEGVFLHALKNSKHNFWPFLKLLLHKSALKQVSSFSQISSDIGKSRAWLRVSLNDCSLDSYLSCIVNDNTLLNKYYHPSAFLLDHECTNQLLEISRDLSSLRFNLSFNASILNKWNNTPLQLSAHLPSPKLKWPTLVAPSNSDDSSPHTSQTLSFTLRVRDLNNPPTNKSPSHLSTSSKNLPHPHTDPTTSHTNSIHPQRSTNNFVLLHQTAAPTSKININTTNNPTTNSSYSNKDSIGILKKNKRLKVDLTESNTTKMDFDSCSMVSRPDFGDARLSVYHTVYVDSDEEKISRGSGGSGGIGGGVGGSGGGVGGGSGLVNICGGGIIGNIGWEIKQQQQSDQQQNDNTTSATLKYQPLQQTITKPKHIKTETTTHTQPTSLQHSSQLHLQQQHHPSFSDAGMVRRIENDSISLSDDLKFKLIVKDNLDRFPLTIKHHKQQQQKQQQQHSNMQHSQQPQHPQQHSNQQETTNQQQLLQQQQLLNSDQGSLQMNGNLEERTAGNDDNTKNHESFRDFLKSYNKKDTDSISTPTNTTTNTTATANINSISTSSITSNTTRTSLNAINTNNLISNTSHTTTTYNTPPNSSRAKHSTTCCANPFASYSTSNGSTPNTITPTKNTTTTNTSATITTTPTATTTTCGGRSVNDTIESLKIKRPKLDEDKSSTDTYTDIQTEKGLASQSFRCHVCSAPIGVSFSKERVCAYSKRYHCDDCMGTLHHYLPSKLIYNWDFNTYNVSNDKHKHLDSLQKCAIININLLNPSLYQHVSKLHDVKVLRERVRCLRSYLSTCQCHLMKHYLQLLGNKAYMYENIHLYSLEDLLKVPSGQLAKFLMDAVNFAANHVYACVLCSQKGFICEICRQDKIIYPFDSAGTVRCEECRSLFHRACKTDQLDCPKCKRLQTRNQSHNTSTSNHIQELLNSQSSFDAQINYSFSDSINSNTCENNQNRENNDTNDNDNDNNKDNNNKDVDNGHLYIDNSSISTTNASQSLISPIS